ncbi:16128_t:CDS:1, partial [Cetraspora pellucida]
MSFHIHTIFEIEPLEYNEQIIDLTSLDNNNLQPIDRNNSSSNNQSCSTSTWVMSAKKRAIVNKFENTILTQFLCVPYSICSKLMYSEKSLWIQRDPNFLYPLSNYTTLVTNPNPPINQIAICSL